MISIPLCVKFNCSNERHTTIRKRKEKFCVNSRQVENAATTTICAHSIQFIVYAECV